jgi:spore maturation protein SpmA
MALSRFWAAIVGGSIVYIFVLLATGRLYTLSHIVNGKQNDPLVMNEMASSSLQQSNPALYSNLVSNKSAGFQSGDTLYLLQDTGVVQVCRGKQSADGIFPTCKNTIMDLWLPLIGYLTFFCGLLHLLQDSGALERLARVLTPLFTRIFPELPPGHPAFGFMTMNFAANFLGLDNAATPFGLKAMESMQAVNEKKDTASNSQIMFLCLHAAGLTLIPTSIIGYRAAVSAANPADVMLPTVITSFIGTLAALVLVGLRQRIRLWNMVVLSCLMGITAVIAALLFYLAQMARIQKFHFTGNLSNGVLLFIIGAVVLYCVWHEKTFRANGTNLFDSFVTGAKEGFTTGVRILPYMIAMLVALSIFRNSGLMNLVMSGLGALLHGLGIDPQIISAMPVALMRPFSAGGSRGLMLDAMKTYGPDSLAGQLSCIYQGAAETTFYVVALYFGSVQVKDTRYTITVMLLVDLVCVLSAIAVCKIYF